MGNESMIKRRLNSLDKVDEWWRSLQAKRARQPKAYTSDCMVLPLVRSSSSGAIQKADPAKGPAVNPPPTCPTSSNPALVCSNIVYYNKDYPRASEYGHFDILKLVLKYDGSESSVAISIYKMITVYLSDFSKGTVF
jgi:hypothetical protein